MKILFIHQNFPGQFGRLALELSARPGIEVVALAQNKRPPIPNVKMYFYELSRSMTRGLHRYVRSYEHAIIVGQAVVRACLALEKAGFKPDVVYGHNGWGETLFLKDIWPDVPVLSFFEFFYSPEGADVGFDPEFPPSVDDRLRLRIKNSVNLVGLEAATWGISPTRWQRSRYPAWAQSRISTIHDGIDTELCRPKPNVQLVLPDGTRFDRGQPVITYVARNLEPYRGYHSFIRALPEILERIPEARVLIVGGKGVSYGSAPKGAKNWVERMEQEVKLDPKRVWHLGQVSYEEFLALLQVSRVHVYLTYPFVLSWSLLEAMSCECAIVGSRTPPVEEAIADGVHGVLVDMLSPREIARAVVDLVADPVRSRALGKAARNHVIDAYDFKRRCGPLQFELLRRLAAGDTPY